MVSAKCDLPPGPVRVGPNGQPLPAMAPSQQQILNAVAAATAARQQQQQQQQQQQNGTDANGNPIRPMMPPGANANGLNAAIQNPQVQHQMQMLQAQQMAARQAQAQAQQAQAQAQQVQQGQSIAQSSSAGTPQSQPGNIGHSPYSHVDGLPNGDGQHGSPALSNPGIHSSPSQQVAAIQAQVQAQQAALGRGHVPVGAPSQHLRVPSTESPQFAQMAIQQGSPNLNIGLNMIQQGTPVPGGGGGAGGGGPSAGVIGNQLMQQIAATLHASGQQVTPDSIRQVSMTMMRNVSAPMSTTPRKL